MAKHNQQRTLGTLTDFQTAPQPAPETTDERIDRLERRLLQVETLLNDIMQQLDKPYRDQPHSNGKTKQAKPKQAKPSTPKAKKTQKAPTPLTPAPTEEQKQADIEAVIAFLRSAPGQALENDTIAKIYQRTLQPKQQASRLSDKTPSQNGASCDCQKR